MEMATLALSQSSWWNDPATADASRASDGGSLLGGRPLTADDYPMDQNTINVGDEGHHTGDNARFEDAIQLKGFQTFPSDDSQSRYALNCSPHISLMPSPGHGLHMEDDTFLPDAQDYAGTEQSPSTSPRPDYPYELRSAPRDGTVTFNTTWLDRDDSGNYDPAEARKRSALKRKKKTCTKTLQDGHTEDDDDPRRPNASCLSWLAARQKGESLVVTLALGSESGRALLASIPDNWPEEDCNVLDERHIHTFLGPEGISSRSHLLRSRNDPAPSEEAVLSSALRDPAGIEEDLTGHPDARGCVACRRLQVRCPLLDDDSTWPCRHCVEDDCDCELISTPDKKRTCEQCKRRRVPCSYCDDGDPALPCQQCSASHSRYVAGPATGARRTRISLDVDHSKRPAPQHKKPASCHACREAKIQCSLVATGAVAPCISCVEDGLDCTLRKPYTSRKGKEPVGGVERFDAGQQHEPEYDPECGTRRETHDADASVVIDSNSTMIDINTSFCHPISFNYDDSARPDRPCHWCESVAYGAFGLGCRDVTVLRNDGLRYTEIINGHAGDGNDPSRMCIACTQARARVCLCSAHELHAVERAARASAADGAAALERLARNRPLPADTWCAVCPAPALYACRAPQADGVWGQPVGRGSPEAEAGAGCGLALCERCAVALCRECGGDLQRLLRSTVAGSEVGRGTVRADAEFLLEDGLLVRNVLAGW